jgi:multidrug efflux system membrane fusion protein
MRALFSYGLAGIMVVIVAAWLATGTLVVGGVGPGKGERPIISAIEGKEDGPIHSTLKKTGLLVEHHADDGSSALSIAERQAAVTGDSAPARSVSVKTFEAKPMAIEVPLRGRTKAKASVAAAAETTGIVDTVHVVKGQKVKTGDLLCSLDRGTREAAVAQAEASLAQAQATLAQAQADSDTNAELRTKGVATANSARALEVGLTAAKAAVSASQSALDNAKAELDRTQIFAKSNGVVEDPLANVGSMLAAGSPCATVVQLDPMVFVGNVPEVHIGLAKLGLSTTIKTVSGQTAEGKVSYISATADAATRTFPIEVEIPNADGKLLDGITAQAIINIGTAPAQLLPQSVLTLDDKGVIGIRAVEDSKVVFYPVTIVNDTREGMWVTGLPLKLDVITVGQEFVQPGQVVTAVQDKGAV